MSCSVMLATRCESGMYRGEGDSDQYAQSQDSQKFVALSNVLGKTISAWLELHYCLA